MKRLLRDIAQLQTGIYAQTNPIGDVYYLQGRHFISGNQWEKHIKAELPMEERFNKYILQKGDVLLAIKGGKYFAALYPEKFAPAIASSTFIVIRPDIMIVNSAYLVWYLNHPKTQKVLQNKEKGTALPSINKKDVEDIEITIPSLEKQHLIYKIHILQEKENELKNSINHLQKIKIQEQLLKAIEE